MNSSYDCSRVVEIEDEPRHHLVIANEFVRVFAVEVPAHTTTLCHHHPHDYLLYVASGAEIISAACDEEPKKLSYSDGECELSDAGLIHVVENLGDSAFRNVVVELKPGARKLRQGATPETIRGEVRTEQILSEEPGVIFRIEMDPGAEVEIAGPAVVVAPYKDEVMLRELDEFDIPLNDFAKPMWVCRPRKVGIRNAGSQRARVIVFQVGSKP